MNIKRVPIFFLAAGLVLKLLLALLWKLWHLPGLLDLLTKYDPGANWFAEKMTRLFFDRGGITFAPGAPTSYETFLIIGFGIECLLVGLVVQQILRRSGGHRNAPSISATR